MNISRTVSGRGVGSSQLPTPGRSPRRYLLAGVAGALIASVVIWVLFGIVLRPGCSNLAKEQADIQRFLAQGKPALAIGLAESALSAGQGCPEVLKTTASLWYRASLDQLFLSANPDEATDRQLAVRWLALEQQAEQHGVAPSARLTPMAVASRAYGIGAWVLADTALQHVWAAGEQGIEVIQLRYALLRNHGRRLTRSAGSGERVAGVRLLATAQALATRYGLPNGEACDDLVQLGYTPCSSTPADPSDLMLQGRPSDGEIH